MTVIFDCTNYFKRDWARVYKVLADKGVEEMLKNRTQSGSDRLCLMLFE